jgi:hypothetical protein
VRAPRRSAAGRRVKARGVGSLTSLQEKLIKIGARVITHGRYVTFQMAEVAVPKQMFRETCR